MPTVAYIANQFPSPVEPYVMDEICELRRRGLRVIPCSARRVSGDLDAALRAFAEETLYLLPLRLGLVIKAAWLCCRERRRLESFITQARKQREKSPLRLIRILLHTWLGAYYALRLREQAVDHIHAHHGYFASWVAMVAARLLGIGFSLTLHGSDLLLHPAGLETKLENCKFCLTVSDFNRRHILTQYPCIEPAKILLHRLGVAPHEAGIHPVWLTDDPSGLLILSVGRLHPVKDHAFLIRACRQLHANRIPFLCLIAGEGPERPRLERLIRDCGLQAEVKLLGHLTRHRLNAFYAACDMVVLTSRSEGIPLVLMEAMSHGRPVLAPAITGIPELVKDGSTGFLYRPGSLEDFVAQLKSIHRLLPALGPLRRAARQSVLQNFSRDKNLADFGALFLERIAAASGESHAHEDSLLQQIQL